MTSQWSQSLAFVAVLLFIVGLLTFAIFMIVKRRRALNAALDDVITLGFAIETKPTRELKEAAFAALGAPKTLRHGAGKIEWVGAAEIDGRRVTLASHAYMIHTGHSTTVIRHVCVGVAADVRLDPGVIKPRNALRRWFVERLGMRVRSERWRREVALRYLCDEVKQPMLAHAFEADAAQDLLAGLSKPTFVCVGPGVVSVLRQGEAQPQVIRELLAAAGGFAGVLAA
ncbi:MAG: hypothetical protein SFY96_09375 [Planctomycetota bacterium]|nr:hypothetical protein [Planctomycetota bacterium]